MTLHTRALAHKSKSFRLYEVVRQEAEWESACRCSSLSLSLSPLNSRPWMMLVIQQLPLRSRKCVKQTLIYRDTYETYHATAGIHVHIITSFADVSQHRLRYIQAALSTRTCSATLMRDPIGGVSSPWCPPNPPVSRNALISINILVWGGREGVCGRQLERPTSRWVIRSYAALCSWKLTGAPTLL